MLDIRQKKIMTPNKKVEHVYSAPVIYAESSKNTYSKGSIFLFAVMTMSMFFYIFMISSSVFYAVRQSQFTYKSDSLIDVAANLNIGNEQLEKYSHDRISYINKDSDTSISLK
jgi:hypothetical protein